MINQLCPKCGSEKLIRKTGADEPSTHYGRLECSDCGRWITWLKDPDTEIKWRQRAEAIDKLKRTTYLSDWEKGFLSSVREQATLSPKQTDKLNAIFQQYTGRPLIDTGMSAPPNWLTSYQSQEIDYEKTPMDDRGLV